MYWILPKDMLPPHGVDVLVTLAPSRKNGKPRVFIGAHWEANGPKHCGEDGWSVDDSDIDPPQAWMALPLPFNVMYTAKPAD